MHRWPRAALSGLLALGLLMAIPAPADAAAEEPCGRPQPGASPLPGTAPNLDGVGGDLPLNPTCRVTEQAHESMRLALYGWAVGLYDSLYQRRDNGAGDMIDELKGCGNEPLGEGHRAKPLFADPRRGCDDGVFSYVRNVLLGGFVQKPSATDIIFKNPSNLLYDNPVVVTWGDRMKGFSFAVIGALLSLTLMQRLGRLPFNMPYPFGDTLSRLVIGALFVLFWGVLARVLIEFTSAISLRFADGLLTAGSRDMVRLLRPGDLGSLTSAEVVALGFYAWSAALLAIVFAVRVVILAAALVLGPIGLLCLIFPDTRHFGRLWASLFANTLFFQAILSAILWSTALFILARDDGGAYLFSPIVQQIFAGLAILASLAATFLTESVASHLHEKRYGLLSWAVSPLTNTIGMVGLAARRQGVALEQRLLARLGR